MSTAVIPEMDVALRRRVAEAMSPSERLTPSEWCPKERRLKAGTTEDPGPMKPWPWQAEFMDAPVDYPEKQGAVMIKGTQLGISEAAISVVGWWADQRPSPILYLMPTDEKAREFEKDRLSYMIRNSPALQEKFFLGKKAGETKASKEFAGGRLRLYGHGSSTKLQSDPYALVVPDELDAMSDFPGEGSAWSMSKQRTKRFTQSWILAMSKPTLEGVGVSAIWENETDQRRFHVPCPHCGEMEWLKFGQIDWDREHPADAAYICEHCKEEITDAQRRKIVYEGTYLSTLPEGEAAERPFVGMHISALYDPKQTISGLVREYLGCNSEPEVQVFFNEQLGEPYTPSEQTVKQEDIADKATLQPKEKLPEGMRFVTMGVDVQHGGWLYLDVSAWDRTGRKYLWLADTVRGWEALKRLVNEYRVPSQKREMRIHGVCIDASEGSMAREVYEVCKEIGPGFCSPVKFGSVGGGEFERTRDTRYGIELHFLDRNHWYSRAISRFVGDEATAGVVLPQNIGQEYIKHMTAPRRRRKEDSYGTVSYEWDTPDQEKDDFVQAAVLAEYGAMMMGLDQTKEAAEENWIPVHQKRRQEEADKRGQTEDEFVRLRKARREGDFISSVHRKRWGGR